MIEIGCLIGRRINSKLFLKFNTNLCSWNYISLYAITVNHIFRTLAVHTENILNSADLNIRYQETFLHLCLDPGNVDHRLDSSISWLIKGNKLPWSIKVTLTNNSNSLWVFSKSIRKNRKINNYRKSKTYTVILLLKWYFEQKECKRARYLPILSLFLCQPCHTVHNSSHRIKISKRYFLQFYYP